MFCPKCGNEVQEGSSFCGGCGASLAGKAPNATGGAGARNAVASVAETLVSGGLDAAKKSGKKKTLTAAAAAVVAIVVVVVIGINVLGGSGVAVKDSTEAYTWEELSKISGEIGKARDEGAAVEIAKKYNLTTKDGKLDGTQTKSVTLSNGMQTAVQIVGFAHDEKANGAKAGITFIFKDIIGEHDMNSSNTNAGGWERSQMRSYLSSEGLNLLPADLKEKVVAVSKLTNNVGETQDVSSVTPTSDRLWLFSLTELCRTIGWSGNNDVLSAEGLQYKLFRDMNVNDGGSNSILEKRLNGKSYTWWARSPVPYNHDDFGCVMSDGDPYHAYNTDYLAGVVPGFCI